MNGSEQGKSVFLAPSPRYQLGIWVEETLLEFESVWELRKCLPDRGKQKVFFLSFCEITVCNLDRSLALSLFFAWEARQGLERLSFPLMFAVPNSTPLNLHPWSRSKNQTTGCEVWTLSDSFLSCHIFRRDGFGLLNALPLGNPFYLFIYVAHLYPAFLPVF